MDQPENRITFSLRLRMTLVMSVLLLLTLAMLQYQDQKAQNAVQLVLNEQREVVRETIDNQFGDIMNAISVGVSSISNEEYLYRFLEKHPTAINRHRIRHILIVMEGGVIEDCSERELVKKIVEVPQLVNDDGSPRANAKPGDPAASFEEGAHQEPADTYWFSVKTTSGERSIAVVVSTVPVQSAIRDSQTKLAKTINDTGQEQVQSTLGVFGVTLAIMILLVWQFTRPIRRLSDAAVRVAGGDLNFTLGIRRRDEIGQLSQTFDKMIEGLKAKSELEERLNQSERAAVIGRLTGAIAHEIRNPLNFINLSIDHVRSKYAPEGERERKRFEGLLGTIKEELARLNRLVTDVLNFGRPANLSARRIDLRETVEQVLGLVRTQADEQGVEIDSRYPEEPAEIDADPEKLKSCFSNIVINAVQAMPGGGRLDVSIVATPDGYRVRFTDTGQGIPAEALDRVFEPYYSTKDTGTGLGLAVTKKIIDEHGGIIRVSSVVGSGTTFDIDLPERRPPAVAGRTGTPAVGAPK